MGGDYCWVAHDGPQLLFNAMEHDRDSPHQKGSMRGEQQGTGTMTRGPRKVRGPQRYRGEARKGRWAAYARASPASHDNDKAKPI